MSEPDIQSAEAALRAMEQLYRSYVFICVEPLQSPTAEQLRALQPLFPGQNYLALRKSAVAGTLRIGPVLPDSAPEFARLAFGDAGITWHTEPPNEAELLSVGIGAP